MLCQALARAPEQGATFVPKLSGHGRASVEADLLPHGCVQQSPMCWWRVWGNTSYASWLKYVGLLGIIKRIDVTKPPLLLPLYEGVLIFYRHCLTVPHQLLLFLFYLLQLHNRAPVLPAG